MRLAAHGLAVDPPAGWDARIYRRGATEPGEVPMPVAHAATIPLPAVRGDYGSGAVELLGADDVFVALLEQDPAAAGSPLYDRPRPVLTAADFRPSRLQRGIPGQSGVQVFFSEGRRAFVLYAVLGSHANRVRLAPRAAALFDGLTVGGRP